MDRWSGRVALVTGSSAGIGAAIVRRLANHGLKVVACARRVDMIQVNEQISTDKMPITTRSLYVVCTIFCRNLCSSTTAQSVERYYSHGRL